MYFFWYSTKVTIPWKNKLDISQFSFLFNIVEIKPKQIIPVIHRFDRVHRCSVDQFLKKFSFMDKYLSCWVLKDLQSFEKTLELDTHYDYSTQLPFMPFCKLQRNFTP